MRIIRIAAWLYIPDPSAFALWEKRIYRVLLPSMFLSWCEKYRPKIGYLKSLRCCEGDFPECLSRNIAFALKLRVDDFTAPWIDFEMRPWQPIPREQLSLTMEQALQMIKSANAMTPQVALKSLKSHEELDGFSVDFATHFDQTAEECGLGKLLKT